MDSKEVWEERVSSAGQRLGFDEGYKILYVPWATIGMADTVFLSLNPGRPPKGAELFTLSDERGNSYEVERDTTASPITAQFLSLAALLGKQPDEILTGTAAPFHSNRWKQLALNQRRAALEVGKSFWYQVFSVKRPKRVIACCPEAAKMASELLAAEHELSIPSGWGSVSLHRYRAGDGALIAQIPHLSTFKLLSREKCRAPLLEVLGLGQM